MAWWASETVIVDALMTFVITFAGLFRFPAAQRSHGSRLWEKVFNRK
jgi:hypothetical protein